MNANTKVTNQVTNPKGTRPKVTRPKGTKHQVTRPKGTRPEGTNTGHPNEDPNEDPNEWQVRFTPKKLMKAQVLATPRDQAVMDHTLANAYGNRLLPPTTLESPEKTLGDMKNRTRVDRANKEDANALSKYLEVTNLSTQPLRDQTTPSDRHRGLLSEE
jgi:hypothetical protein